MTADVKCPKCGWNLTTALSVMAGDASFQASAARLVISGLEVIQAELTCPGCGWHRTLEYDQVEVAP